MGRGRAKAKQSKVNRVVRFPGTRSAKRESVAADVQRFLDGGDGPDGEGSAGVREPRNPKPKPMSSGGERPMPQQQFAMSLPDPRY
jgi:hypothetical protein